MCPLCGAVVHVNTGNPEVFEERYPEIRIVGYASRICHDCEPELVEGDEIAVRGSAERIGRIIVVAKCKEGHRLYRVRFTTGEQSTYPRVKLTKLRA